MGRFLAGGTPEYPRDVRVRPRAVSGRSSGTVAGALTGRGIGNAHRQPCLGRAYHSACLVRSRPSHGREIRAGLEEADLLGAVRRELRSEEVRKFLLSKAKIEDKETQPEAPASGR